MADMKRRDKKVEGLDDNWKGLKVNPIYNTSAVLKAAIDRVGEAMSGKPKKKK